MPESHDSGSAVHTEPVSLTKQKRKGKTTFNNSILVVNDIKSHQVQKQQRRMSNKPIKEHFTLESIHDDDHRTQKKAPISRRNNHLLSNSLLLQNTTIYNQKIARKENQFSKDIDQHDIPKVSSSVFPIVQQSSSGDLLFKADRLRDSLGQSNLFQMKLEEADVSCTSFYELINKPILQPVPVCGSRDYPSHSVHCYQSLIGVNPNQPSLSLRSSSSSGTVKYVTPAAASLGLFCSFQYIAVNRWNIMKTLRDCVHNCDVRSSKSLFLLDSKKVQCPVPTLAMLMNVTEEHDYTRNFVQELLMLNSMKHLSNCDKWVNKTAIFFIANEPYIIYFQFLTYYNIFTTMKLLGSTNALTAMKARNDFVLFRLSEVADYKFGEFERRLFPQVRMMSDISPFASDSKETSSNITCFRKVFKVPWAYSALPFRCVIDGFLRNETLKCYSTSKKGAQSHIQGSNQGHENFRHVNEQHSSNSLDRTTLINQHSSMNRRIFKAQSLISDVMAFRSLVLRTCKIVVTSSNSLQPIISGKLESPVSGTKPVHLPLNVVMIKRKPYLRHWQDHPSLFQRILSNEQQLITALSHNIPSNVINLTTVYMEELDICEQVRMAHKADILIGVHGAGLVHLWWMRNSGVVLELVPPTKLSWPTYEVLASLTNRNYYSVVLDESVNKHQNNVNVSEVMEALDRITKTFLSDQ